MRPHRGPLTAEEAKALQSAGKVYGYRHRRKVWKAAQKNYDGRVAAGAAVVRQAKALVEEARDDAR